MDYEAIYDQLLGKIRMPYGVATFYSDRAKDTDGDDVRLPTMADIYWSMAFKDSAGHIPASSMFLSAFATACFEITKDPNKKLAFCHSYKIDPSAIDVDYQLGQCFLGRAKRTFPSLARDQAMITRLGSPRYGKLKVIYSSSLDTMFKMDVTVVFEDGGVCGLGLHVDTNEGRQSYVKHLERMNRSGRGHGNVPVLRVELGKACKVADKSVPCDGDVEYEQSLWLPTQEFVDRVVEVMIATRKPKLSMVTDPKFISPKEEIEKAITSQETRWPNVVLNGLRALTSLSHTVLYI